MPMCDESFSKFIYDQNLDFFNIFIIYL